MRVSGPGHSKKLDFQKGVFFGKMSSAHEKTVFVCHGNEQIVVYCLQFCAN